MMSDLVSLAINILVCFLSALAARGYWPALGRQDDPVVTTLARAIVMMAVGVWMGSGLWAIYRIVLIVDFEPLLPMAGILQPFAVLSKMVLAAAAYLFLVAKLRALPLHQRRHWTPLTVAWFDDRNSIWVRLIGVRCLRRAFKWKR